MKIIKGSVKYIYKNLWTIIGTIFEFGIPIIAVLFLISLPFALIGAIIEYFKYDFTKDANGILESISPVSHEVYRTFLQFIEQYPKSIIVFVIFIFILMIKSLSSHVIARKHDYKSLFKNIFHILITLSLILSIVYYENIDSYLKLQIDNFNMLIAEYISSDIVINFNIPFMRVIVKCFNDDENMTLNNIKNFYNQKEEVSAQKVIIVSSTSFDSNIINYSKKKNGDISLLYFPNNFRNLNWTLERKSTIFIWYNFAKK